MSAPKEAFHVGIKGFLSPFLCLKGRNWVETLPGRSIRSRYAVGGRLGGPGVALPWADFRPPGVTRSLMKLALYPGFSADLKMHYVSGKWKTFWVYMTWSIMQVNTEPSGCGICHSGVGFFLCSWLCSICGAIAGTCEDSNISTRLIKCLERFNPLRFLKAYQQVRCNSPYRAVLCVFWCLYTYFCNSDVCTCLSAILHCSIHRCMLHSGYNCHLWSQIWMYLGRDWKTWQHGVGHGLWRAVQGAGKPWEALGCFEMTSC